MAGIAEQIEQLNLIFTLGDPRLYDLAVMYPQIVQNQEHRFPGILDQSSQEFNQLLGLGQSSTSEAKFAGYWQMFAGKLLERRVCLRTSNEKGQPIVSLMACAACSITGAPAAR